MHGKLTVDAVRYVMSVGENNPAFHSHRVVEDVFFTQFIHAFHADDNFITAIIGNAAADKAGIAALRDNFNVVFVTVRYKI